jgi:hypothetical protein
MNSNPFRFLALSALIAIPAFGQPSEESAARRLDLQSSTDRPIEKFRVSYRMGFNMSANIKNLGNSAPTRPQPPDPPAGAGPFRSATGLNYQDGYVGVDFSTNEFGISTYYGYASTNQIVGDSLLLTYSAAGTLFQDINTDPQHGIELTYSRQLGEIKRWKWGMEGSLFYMDLDFRTTGVANPQVMAIHAFGFGGFEPPRVNGFTGTYDGSPGGYVPVDATPAVYPVNVVSEFKPAIYGFKLGPYFEYPLADRLSLNLSGGFALMLADADYLVRESVTIPGQGTVSRRTFNSDLGVLPGGYITGGLSYSISESVDMVASVQYQYADRYSHNVADKRAEIDFRQSLFVSFGFSHSF